MKNEKFIFHVFLNYKWRHLFFIFHFSFFVLFLSCKNKNPLAVTPAFYHWQTRLQLTPAERKLVDSLNVKKLYVKFFDIDINENGEPSPNAVVEIDTQLLDGLEIIPTVFITNRTFKNISQKQIKKLADNIFQKISDLYSHPPSKIRNPKSEIQFDCDWTQTTRDNYFYFLSYFKTLITHHSSLITATIRLHQLKYPDQTGVPPVDRGMLMFYNMGDLENWATENSILDLTIAEQYLPSRQSAVGSSQYLLPLDIALPIFKWGVIFRNNELVYLINNLSEKEMLDTARFIKIKENRFEVKRSTYLGDYYLYEGDLVRLEWVGPELLQEAGARLSKFLKLGKPKSGQKETTISFYHLDTTTLASFRYEDFVKILGQF